MKTLTTLKINTLSEWKPLCVYWSPFTEDLLVGMVGQFVATANKGIVIRYNQAGEITQRMQKNNNEQKLYSKPQFITDSNTGDFLVSDYCNVKCSVVVT